MKLILEALALTLLAYLLPLAMLILGIACSLDGQPSSLRASDQSSIVRPKG
jgi:hypothetical protein